MPAGNRTSAARWTSTHDLPLESRSPGVNAVRPPRALQLSRRSQTSPNPQPRIQNQKTLVGTKTRGSRQQHSP